MKRGCWEFFKFEDEQEAGESRSCQKIEIPRTWMETVVLKTIFLLKIFFNFFYNNLKEEN